MSAERGRQLRVLHLRSHFGRRGGPEELIRSILRKADASRFVHHLALMEQAAVQERNILEDEPALAGRLHRVRWGRKGPRWSGVRAVDEVIRQHRIDVVHCHDNRANFMACMVPAAWRLARIASQHGYIGTSLKMRILLRMDRWVLRAFDRVVVASERMARELGAGVTGRVVCIPNGIEMDAGDCDVDVQATRTSLGFAKDDRVIGVVGRLSEEKGHVYLLQAVSELALRHPTVRCLVVGDGPLRQPLERQAATLGIADRVRFTGIVPDTRPLLALMEVFVQPSILDCLPLTILEAMAAGKPVVATRVGDIAGGVEDGVTGLLVPPRDGAALADAVSHLLDDPLRLDTMSAATRRRVTARFSDLGMVRGWEALYDECAARSTRAER